MMKLPLFVFSSGVMLAGSSAAFAAAGAAANINHVETPATGAIWMPSTPTATAAFGEYPYGPDSEIHPGVPQGTMVKTRVKSTVYPGTERDVWIYVPAQYDAKTPACLMVIQDGPRQYAERTANQGFGHTPEYRVPTVLDNLIARGELPVIITVFVDPGSTNLAPLPLATTEATAVNTAFRKLLAQDASAKTVLNKYPALGVVDPNQPTPRPSYDNRSVEYDTVSDTYSQFLKQEILPLVAKYNLRQDPAGRAIGGISSGAICAFTVAWNHPDWFGKVLSDVGSFTNIRGGHVYPQLVREADKKPLKVFMQDGVNDNRSPDNLPRDWYLQNKLMYEALRDKGYEVRYVLGDNVHGSKMGGPIFPDSLRWLWSDQVVKPAVK